MMRHACRRFVLFVGDLLTLIYCRRYEVVGGERVPESGGVIVVSNHLNNADPPMIQRALPRHVVFGIAPIIRPQSAPAQS